MKSLGLYQRQGSLGSAVVSIAATVVVALSLIPLIYLLVRASERPGSETLTLLLRAKTLEVLSTTALLVLLVVCLTGFFGLIIAAGLHFLELPAKAWLIIPAVLPLAIPSYVFTYTWIAFVPEFSGFFAAVFILSLTTLPYVTLACLAGFARVDASQIEVARTLGLSYLKTFFKVVLPQIRIHLSGGLLLAGLYTMSDFGAVSLLNVDTLTVTIQNMYRASYDRTGAAVISLVLISLSALFVLADERTRQSQRSGQAVKTTSMKSALIDNTSYRLITVAFIGVYATCAVLIPVYVLLSRFFTNTVEISWQLLLQASFSTITVALFGALIALLLSIPLGILFSEKTNSFSKVSSQLILVAHALPGVVVGLALVSFGSKLGALYQSTFLLAFAYSLLFLAKSVASMSASLKQVPTGAKEVAATLGLNRWSVLKNVVTPIAAPGILLGAILVFLTAMKELPATLMLRPTGFETLATQIWSYAAINRFNEAAPYALILILIAAIPTFILSRPDRSDRGSVNSGLGN